MYLLVIFLIFLFGFVLTLVVSLQLLLERAAPPNARSWNLECMATTSLVCILSYSSGTMHTSSYSLVVVVCILCIASMETVYYARIY